MRKHIVPIIIVGILVMSGLVTGTIPNEKPMLDNQPPYPPLITGSTITRAGIPYECTLRAIDPDGDDVSYEIDWGDHTSEQWIGWYASGEEIKKNHTYVHTMRVLIEARAKDTHGAIGEWWHMNIIIPKDKQIFNLPFLQFLMSMLQFPLIQRLLDALGWLM